MAWIVSGVAIETEARDETGESLEFDFDPCLHVEKFDNELDAS
jgi:hypothetical protein